MRLSILLALAATSFSLDSNVGNVALEDRTPGCCCDSDACIDPNYNRYPSRRITCYVGVWNGATNQSMGVDSHCDGKCASIYTYVNNKKYKAYFCLNQKQAESLNVDNGCRRIPADREVEACVCDNANNCNVNPGENVLQNPHNTSITFSPPTFSEPTIACYSGLWINGNVAADGGYIGCQGKCAAISLTTALNGAPQTATLYTCDPATVCSQLNLINSCGSPEPGVKGCCCDSDVCIDPNYNRSPGRALQCYVGVWNAATNASVGDYTTCDGKCASVSTYQNGKKAKAYFCLNMQQTETFGVDNGCRILPADRSVEACACDDKDNCNIKPGETPNLNPANITYDAPPITCWSGAYVNNFKQGQVGWVACTGNCASIQLNTTYYGVASSFILYTCDPVAACKVIGLNNSCNTVDGIPNLMGCCCDQNACMTSASIYPVTPKPSYLSTVGTTKAASPTTIKSTSKVTTAKTVATTTDSSSVLSVTTSFALAVSLMILRQ